MDNGNGENENDELLNEINLDQDRSGKIMFKQELTRQGVWLLSRVLFLVAVVALSLFLKKPVEDFIQRDALSDLNKIHEDERITALQEVRETKKCADDAFRAFDSAFIVLTRSKSFQDIKLQRQFILLAKRNIDDLRVKYHFRKSTWPNEFGLVIYDLWARLNRGIKAIDTIMKSSSIISDKMSEIEIKKELVSRAYRRLDLEFENALKIINAEVNME